MFGRTTGGKGGGLIPTLMAPATALPAVALALTVLSVLHRGGGFPHSYGLLGAGGGSLGAPQNLADCDGEACTAAVASIMQMKVARLKSEIRAQNEDQYYLQRELNREDSLIRRARSNMQEEISTLNDDLDRVLQEHKPQGKRGPPGVAGLTVVGPPGVQGAPGRAGPAGRPGQNGVDGAVGLQGIRGVDEVGPQGPTGPVGERGAPGRRGLTGSSGLPGPYGASGWDGVAGRGGDPGMPGVSTRGYSVSEALRARRAATGLPPPGPHNNPAPRMYATLERRKSVYDAGAGAWGGAIPFSPSGQYPRGVHAIPYNLGGYGSVGFNLVPNGANNWYARAALKGSGPIPSLPDGGQIYNPYQMSEGLQGQMVYSSYNAEHGLQ